MQGLAILLAHSNDRGGGDLRCSGKSIPEELTSLVGSWAGDRIVVAGDYDDDWLFVPEDLKGKVTTWEGNIIVKGTVAGSVHTSRHLSVEPGARITANVRAGSAQIAGEVRGNMKIKEMLELTSTARVMGDIEVKTLVIEAGALVAGKVLMPGLEATETKRSSKLSSKKSEEVEMSA
jgi:cytoskeletal protein CcmA (bactofilin family)